MKEKLKFMSIILLFFFSIVLMYLNLSKNLNNVKEIGQIQYSSLIGIDSGSITTYYIFEKNNELYYRENINQITINGEIEEKNQEFKKIKNIDELKKEIEKRKKTDQEFKYKRVSVKCFIKNKELNEKEFWNELKNK